MRRHPGTHPSPYRRPAYRPAPAPKASRSLTKRLITTAIAAVGIYGFFDDVTGIFDTAREAGPAITAAFDAQDALGNVARFAPIEGFERTLTTDPTIASAKGYWPEGRVNVQMSYQSPEEVLEVTFKDPETQVVVVTFEVDYQNPPKETLENVFRRKLKDADALASL